MEEPGKSYQSKEFFESLKSYAKTYHYKDLETILLSEKKTQYYSIFVNSMMVLSESIEFAHFLFDDPKSALGTLKDAFIQAAEEIFKEQPTLSSLNLQNSIQVRLKAFPQSPEVYRKLLPKCKDVGQFLCITGTIVRCTIPKMMEFRKKWKCTKCCHEFTKDIDVEQSFEAVKPIKCENPDFCSNKNFSIFSGGIRRDWCRDYQEVKIQEQFQYLSFGRVPRSMWVILFDDLVDACQPGNEVLISGILHTRWKSLVKGMRSEIELVLVAQDVVVKNNSSTLDLASENSLNEFSEFWMKHSDNPLVGRNFILSCFCPQVYGLYIVKLAIAVVLAGGVQRIDNDGKIRGDLHLLLVGDPGTGKSQFLKYASKISQRSVFVSGVGTTNAGLTAAAVKDGGKWQLEAGALVLADGGICCIDEFSSIKTHDKACVHEAMEQQTISIAKAGLVCKLNTQCSILAATNPKTKYDKDSSLCVNTALASPLLSRFDVILVLLDTYSESWDKKVSSHVLYAKKMEFEEKNDSEWSLEKIRIYFSTIKKYNPELTPDCTTILQAYYLKQRSFPDRNAARTTPRLLQSLIRLSQGHAKLMFRIQVLPMDAIAAVTILESSMLGCGLFDDHSNALHSTFPDDPQSYFKKQAEIILNALNLKHLMKKVFDGNSPILVSSQQATVTIPNLPLFNNTQNIVNSEGAGTLADRIHRHCTQLRFGQCEPVVSTQKDDVCLTTDLQNTATFSKFFSRKRKNDTIGDNVQSQGFEASRKSSKRNRISNRDDIADDSDFLTEPKHASTAIEPFRAPEDEGSIFQKEPSKSTCSVAKDTEKSKVLTDDVTTLSELNEIFSVDLESDRNDEPIASLNLFKRFAFGNHRKNKES